MDDSPEQTVIANLREISSAFAAARAQREPRRHLDPADFAALRDAGYLRMSLPIEGDGLWRDLRRSIRPICEMLRILAQGDGSVALVAAMHPTVVAPWLAWEEAPGPHREAWRAQRDSILASVREGAWWGTVKSEPGSGGDVARTSAVARRGEDPLHYHLTGDKHFGSGSGIVSFFVTTAIPEGEDAPDVFCLDVRGAPWDGSTGMKLVAEWDGMGMCATQSHAFRFESFPVERMAWPRARDTHGPLGAVFDQCAFSAVGTGIVQAAMAAAKRRVEGRGERLRALERVEWTRAQTEAWLLEQAYDGMLRAVEETGSDSLRPAIMGKTAIADLGTRLLERVCRVVGGGAYSRREPYGPLLEDFRALGFLRPPWSLAFDLLHDLEG